MACSVTAEHVLNDCRIVERLNGTDLSVLNTKPDCQPDIADGLEVGLVVQDCKNVFPIRAELAEDQVLLDGGHAELVGEHVIRAAEVHVGPEVLKPVGSQQCLCLVETLGLDISNELSDHVLWLPGFQNP